MEKLEPEKTLDAWKEFEGAITIWKTQLNQKSEAAENREVKSKEQREKRSAEDEDSKHVGNVSKSTAEDINNELMEGNIPKLKKSGDQKLSKIMDPTLAKTVDPRLKKSANHLQQKLEVGMNNLQQESLHPSLIKLDPPSEQGHLNDNLSDKHLEQGINFNGPENAVLNSNETAPEEPQKELANIDAEELDTIAQFLENSS